MLDCHNRLVVNHPRTGVAHNPAYPFTHLGFVAMHLAVLAECPRLHEGAVFVALASVLSKFLTLRTQPVSSTVVFFALTVQVDHRFDKPLLISKFLLGIGFTGLTHAVIPYRLFAAN
jgi:hypothetical protein